MYRFGNVTVNCETRQLLRESTAVHVSPKAFRLLELLVTAAPRALSKAELQDCLWPDTFVVEANLQHLISELRTVLVDDPRRPRYLRTVHGFGYAFQATPTHTPTRPSPSSVLCRLRWESGRVTLSEGEHTIGRDPTADVVLDSVHVSRRHARIRLYDGEVTIEDLGSKNGTFVRDQRVDGTVELGDRDHLRFGGLEVDIRISSHTASTETIRLDFQRRSHAR